MNVNNLDRDMFHLSIVARDTWPTVIGGINSSGIINQVQATCLVADTTTVSGTSVGLWFEPPNETPTPYRVKVYTVSADLLYLQIGYASGAVTGVNDTIAVTRGRIPLRNGEFDDIILLDGQTGTNPLFIGVTNGGAASYSDVALSVQKLNTAPPKYNSAIK